MSSPDVVSLLESSKELDRVRKEQEEILSEINKLHKKLQTTPEVVEKPGDTSLARLKVLYTQAKDLSESEANISSLMLSQIDGILPTGPQGQTRRRIGKGNEQKRKRVKTESDISRLNPTMRNHLEACASLKGEQLISCQVAARVTPRNADKDEWFVVKVIHFDKESKEFEVLDEEPGDDEESSGQRQYKLPMGNIIAFPKSNDPSSAQDFPPGKHVLAVYPGTTALYKATVVQGPRRFNFCDSDFILTNLFPMFWVILQHFVTVQRKTEDYVLEFDDDEEDGSLPQRTVPFHKVVLLPEGHRQ
ncbi:SAGA-associated factor 29 homolog B-like isoform X2 [Vigna umbellata]|uniref:SAGA-associated factor 29 homolog B-like isoform X2 n=1 Tax=Vigna umbellata TaxID=87088 RepID=UPI001F5E47FA|nr:SAGA-associated factor 29 homolog B-like isoform X2 [Vigna umbellata]